MIPLNIKKIEINKLIPHEDFREDHAVEVLGWFERDGFQLRPIAVHKLSEGSFLILDGHHRTEAARRLNLKFVMASVLDYFDHMIVVESWDNGRVFSKEEIIQLATDGKKVPPKSTKHIIKINGQNMVFQDNDFVEPKIYTNLEALKI